MKTWEMIKELTENPNKKFISKDELNGTLHCVLNSNLLQFEHECRKYGKEVYIATERAWKEVKEPVSFMEAVIAFQEGKAIYCEWDNDTYYYRNEDSCLEEDGTGFPISSDEILEGKWYVED